MSVYSLGRLITSCISHGFVACRVSSLPALAMASLLVEADDIAIMKLQGKENDDTLGFS
jgi:hypothetical protein